MRQRRPSHIRRTVGPARERVTRARAFARALAARYRLAGARTRWSDLLYVHSPAVFVSCLTRQSRLTLYVSTAAKRFERANRQKSSFEASREVLRMLAPPAATLAKPALPQPAAMRSPLAAALTQRWQRVEATWRSDRASVALHDVAAARQGATSETLLSPPHAAQSTADLPLAAPRHRIAAQGTRPELTPSETVKAVAAAPPTLRATLVPDHELERLAERVIGSIDRRIVAQRERFGRP